MHFFLSFELLPNKSLNCILNLFMHVFKDNTNNISFFGYFILQIMIHIDNSQSLYLCNLFP